MRHSFLRAEPKTTSGVAISGAHSTTRKSVRCGEVFEMTGSRIELIQPASRREIDPPSQIFGDRTGRVAGKAVRSRVRYERRLLSGWLVQPHESAAQRTEPQSSFMIYKR